MDERRRLNTWGEIADYFQCDIRTAQRWAKGRGLPVHRLPGGKRSSVFAFEDELAEWSTSSKAEVADEGTADAEAEPPVASETPVVVAANAAGPLITRRVALAGLGVGLPVAAAAGWLLLSRKPRTPARATITGDALVVFDETGAVLWTDRFRGQTQPFDPTLRWPAQVLDLDGSGEAGVLAVCNFVNGSGSNPQGEVRYYGAGGGKPRWVCSLTPRDLLDHQGKEIQNTWNCAHLITTAAAAGGKGRSVWAAVHHGWRSPGAVMHIDCDGKSRVQVAQTGHVYGLGNLGRLIAFCGVNNAIDLSSAGVFNIDDPPATSPAVGREEYMFARSPKGVVQGYALFPTTELELARDMPYGIASGFVEIGESLLVKVNCLEAGHLTYEFTKTFEPVQVSDSSSFGLIHKKLELEQKLDHDFPHCPLFRAPVHIRRWVPSTGWQDRLVPWGGGSHSLNHT